MSYTAHKEGDSIPLQLQEKKLEDLFVRGAFVIFHALYDTDAINGTERIKLVVQAKNLSELFSCMDSRTFGTRRGSKYCVRGVSCVLHSED